MEKSPLFDYTLNKNKPDAYSRLCSGLGGNLHDAQFFLNGTVAQGDGSKGTVSHALLAGTPGLITSIA